MSVIRGKMITFDGTYEGSPAIKYVQGRDEYVLRVPNMYEALVLKLDEIGEETVYISGSDLWRLLKFDNWYNKGNIPIDEEQQELDDSTYLGISYIQAHYYLSKATMDTAKRVSKKFRYPEWIKLSKRVSHSRRTVPELTEEERERIGSMINDYDRIVKNLFEHDWAEEYVNLRRDVAKYKGEKCPPKKRILEEFAEQRKRYLEK